MKTKVILFAVLGVVGLAVLILGGSAIGSYNDLVTKREEIRGRWSEVENQLQRRADLINNLVETVKGITKQEQEVFVKIAEARSRLLSANTPQEKIAANEQLDNALRSGGLITTGGNVNVLALQERYPELRSSENFRALQFEIAGTENRLAVARRDYNLAVAAYNTARSQFPTVLVAGLMGFNREDSYFRAEEGSRQAPQVKF